jgi:hypothetical protein
MRTSFTRSTYLKKICKMLASRRSVLEFWILIH